jgi:alpha-glucosidase
MWVLGKHDHPRIGARVGPAQARIAAMLLLTLRGTPTMYYGDEIGMPRVDVAPELAQDPWEKNEPGLGVSRDPSRTPMQWDGSPHAGFTTGAPWLPIDPDYRERNVASLRQDPRSILSLYRRLIEIRNAHPALSIGSARVLGANGNVVAFERSYEAERIVVALNFGNESCALPDSIARDASILLSTHMDAEGPLADRTLRGNEGIILRMNA